MDFFERFSSCTAAGSGSQNWFETDDENKHRRCRVYYKLSRSTQNCALMYSNLIDSTYADGSHSHANFVPGEWTLHSLRAGLVSECSTETCVQPERFTDISFDGCLSKRVHPGEIFYSDPFRFEARKGEYMCVEAEFSGKRIPCHTESLLPAFRSDGDEWYPCTDIPFPCMLGSERKSEIRLGFLGDSITQGIGTAPNAYAHLAAYVQDALGEKCAVWNLGLGYGRAHDAALDGAWLYRARQNEVVCVCYGVNDLFQTGNAAQLKQDLACIVRALRESGVKTVLETVPPFDYEAGIREKWLDVNGYILSELSKEADACFDTVPVLGKSPLEPYASRYGAHPDEKGNAAWAQALLPVLRKVL